jgi:hypothetical protein
MIWPLVFGIIFLFGLKYYYWKKYTKLGYTTFFKYIRLFIVGMSTTLLLGFVFGFAVGIVLPKEWSPEPKTILADAHEALLLDNGKYYFYYEKDGNAYVMNSLPMSDVTVYEEDRRDAIIQKYDLRFKNKIHEWLGIMLPHYRYDFFIPKGKLKSFNLRFVH